MDALRFFDRDIAGLTCQDVLERMLHFAIQVDDL